MIDNKRRTFLRTSSALAATGALTACGAGSSPEELGNQFASGVVFSEVPTPTGPGTGTAATVPGARFTVMSTTGQSSVPFCLGFAFRRGDVISGRTVVSDKGTLQMTVKNRWPDGSVKFAVLAGQAAVSGTAATTINVSSAAATTTTAAAITTAALKTGGAVAEVTCGAFGTVLWENTAWDTPFQTWVSGPAMSSFIYRKRVGTDTHLVAWLEVRVWANGAIEMLPWIENGFLRVAAPKNKSATFTFKLNRTQRMSALIDLKHHTRTPLIKGAALSYWAATDMGVIARQDSAYLQSTGLVPSYFGQLAAGAAVLNGLVTTYTPLQAGNFYYDEDNMASSGYQTPIGMLPQHDVAYLISDLPVTYGALVRNGFSAGRWAIHYRDETTNRPLRFSRYPTLNIGDNEGFKDVGGSTNGQYTPTPTGGNPPGWDVAHSPSVGFLAYLATGRWYFMEEVQFATTANYLGNGDNEFLRTGSKGLVQSAVGAWQTRSCAWDWRARVQACASPRTTTPHCVPSLSPRSKRTSNTSTAAMWRRRTTRSAGSSQAKATTTRSASPPHGSRTSLPPPSAIRYRWACRSRRPPAPS
ncbi:hypothetical protein D3872_11120 [Massilia cavernae]|uniref:Twin-arginine translocation signal domain-containing protein n=1 Tax=Massilia cavernae TaxID=2320864 RepID=A0A418XUL8_9BURK|nr:hypothetical protein D3872_11120 [Massilia cavernae]